MIGFIDDFFVQFLLSIQPYSIIADLRTFQFTVAQAIGSSISISSILATALNTGTVTSNHYEDLSFLLQSPLDCRLSKTRPNSLILSISTP
jgi:hypothetical protein